MEGDWRWNVIQLGWEDYAVTGIAPIYPMINRLAYLITPVTIFGVEYNAIMTIGEGSNYHKWYVRAGLPTASGPENVFGADYLPGPFPMGQDVLPDHP